MKSTHHWLPGTRLRFRWPTHDDQPLIVEYRGPGWGPTVFAGRDIETGHEATDWSRDAFEPLPQPEALESAPLSA